MHILKQTILAIMLVSNSSCKDIGNPKDVSNWYDEWLNHSTSQFEETFHSVHKLASGKKVSISVNAHSKLTIGFLIKDGYAVTKDKGTIYMGTPEVPRMLRASPGSWREFEPKDGKVKVVFENTSSVDTELVVYTAKPKKTSK